MYLNLYMKICKNLAISIIFVFQVRQSTVKVDGQSYNSIEVKGPVMPDAVYNFCDLLSNSLKKFTATFANLETTKPFTLASMLKKGKGNKF